MSGPDPTMSGPEPGDDADRDLLAAEYLLGLLDPASAEVVARQVSSDPALAQAVDRWSVRLDPLSGLATPMQPTGALWDRIARDVEQPAPAPPSLAAVRPRLDTARGWRVAAFAGFALAACLAIFAVLSGHRLDVHVAWDAPRPVPPSSPAPPASPTPLAPKTPPGEKLANARPAPAPVAKAPASAPKPEAAPERRLASVQPPAKPAVGADTPRAIALLGTPGSDRPAMKALVSGPGRIVLEALKRVDVPPGKALGFWVWPRGTQAPILVGRVPAEGGTLAFPYTEDDGTPVMVTMEPRDLPNTGQQGPTLFQGQLAYLN